MQKDMTIEKRLQELREEYKTGQRKLDELDLQRSAIRDTMLRISGAIQALEELPEGTCTDATTAKEAITLVNEQAEAS